ncbi:metalloregulator ArsR/SmtB family transcription factor [Saccharothrix sp. NRRL B-16348]|uniref:metalloregulator ArsR/SmtB family transcription factor n=1 Tax=Saccharothrix sp. NRRL B-16348 TaxID=1415542 RepID=UPI0009E86180|nr:metalloregulator ArsR/SmtB family transcription factor [Saccharothrix sp. NRRL B-16348]
MDEVAGAIADPVRREILEMLRADARLSAGQIAERFAISRPAVSRHLRVLRESGLVRDELVGRQRFYVLDASRLTPLARWLAEFAVLDRPSALAHHLDALETEVYRTRRERRAGQPDSGQSRASQSHTGELDSGQSRTAGQPRTGQSHAAGPRTGQPEAGQPEAGRPGGVDPEIAELHAAGPPVGRSRTGRLAADESPADESKENTA